MKLRAVIPFLLLSFFVLSCSNKKEWSEEVLSELSKSVSRTGKPLSRLHLNYYGSKKIEGDQLKELDAAYRRFYKLYNKTLPQYREIIAVRKFLVSYMDTPALKKSRGYNGNSPVAVANALLFATGIDLNNIDDSTFLSQGQELLDLTEAQLNHGIFHLITHSNMDVINQQRSRIVRNMNNKRFHEPQKFAQHIMLPYCTAISSGVRGDSLSFKRISKLFNTVYEAEGDPLREWLENFTGYMNGGVMNVKYLRRVNAVLRKYELYLAMDNDYCALFTVHENVDIQDSILSAIQIIDETPLSRRTSRLGSAMYKEAVVNIYEHPVTKELDEVFRVLDGDITDSTLLERIEQWQVTSSVPADSIYFAVYKRDFSGKIPEQVYKDIVREVAIHESKHAWDAQFDTGTRRRRLFDVEVSAHLTEAILSETPHYSLTMFLHRIHSYLGYGELRKPIYQLNGSIWELVEKSLAGAITEEQLRDELRGIYRNYLDRDGFHFPELEKYEQEIGQFVVGM